MPRYINLAKFDYAVFSAIQAFWDAVDAKSSEGLAQSAIQELLARNLPMPRVRPTPTDLDNLLALSHFLDECASEVTKPPAGQEVSAFIGQTIQSNSDFLAAVTFLKDTFTIKRSRLTRWFRGDNVPSIQAPDLRTLQRERAALVEYVTGHPTNGVPQTYGQVPPVDTSHITYGETSFLNIDQATGEGIQIEGAQNGAVDLFQVANGQRRRLARGLSQADLNAIGGMVMGQWQRVPDLAVFTPPNTATPAQAPVEIVGSVDAPPVAGGAPWLDEMEEQGLRELQARGAEGF